MDSRSVMIMNSCRLQIAGKIKIEGKIPSGGGGGGKGGTSLYGLYLEICAALKGRVFSRFGHK